MPGLTIAILIVNFLWLAYLTFLVYRRSIRPATVKPGVIPKSATKIRLFRFNPFNDVGGEQSFSLVLLDETNSGAIVTSLHNRNLTRVYAKPVKNGEGEIPLSNEEKNAIFKTINS